MRPQTLSRPGSRALAWFHRALFTTLLFSTILSAHRASADVCAFTLDPQTVGLWHCDEGTGTTVADASSAHHDGQLVGGAGWTAPLCGTSAVGFSTGTQMVQFAGSITGNLPQGTVECTFVWSGNLVDTEPWIFDQFLPSSASNLGLTISKRCDATTPGCPDWHLWFTINRVFVASGSTVIQPNQRYAVASTWDGTTARIYLNGVLDGEGATNLTPTVTSDPFVFGADAGGATGTSQFLGTIDEIRLSSVARVPTVRAEDVPVLLVPGVCESPSVFTTCTSGSPVSCSSPASTRLGDILVSHGFTKVYTADFGAHFGESPRSLAAILGARIDEVLTATQGAKLNLVAHSMGGLTARWAIQKLGYADRVANLVMIGTPNHGSELAYLLATFTPRHPGKWWQRLLRGSNKTHDTSAGAA